MKLVLTAGDARPASREDKKGWGRSARWNMLKLYGMDGPDENELLRVIEEAEGKKGDALGAAWFAIRALYGIATPRAVPVLKRAMYYPRRDVKGDAFGLIEYVSGADEAPFYLDTLRDKRYPLKGPPIAALGRWGGTEAIGDVVRRAKVVLRKEDRHLRASRFEVIHVVRLLARHTGDARARTFFDFLSSRWTDLKPHERWSIADLLKNAGLNGVWEAEPDEMPLGLLESVWDFSSDPPRKLRAGPTAA